MNITRFYREVPDLKLQADYLPDDIYREAVGALIIVVTDAVIISRERESFFLAKRRAKPMDDWWMIGGRRKFGETPIESVVRCFKRETTLDLEQNRFRFVTVLEWLFKSREQHPQEMGCHSLSHTFAVDLNDAEIKKVAQNLDPDEYVSGSLREFDRVDLVEKNVFESVIDVYDLVFPT